MIKSLIEALYLALKTRHIKLHHYRRHSFVTNKDVENIKFWESITFPFVPANFSFFKPKLPKRFENTLREAKD